MGQKVALAFTLFFACAWISRCLSTEKYNKSKVAESVPGSVKTKEVVPESEENFANKSMNQNGRVPKLRGNVDDYKLYKARRQQQDFLYRMQEIHFKNNLSETKKKLLFSLYLKEAKKRNRAQKKQKRIITEKIRLNSTGSKSELLASKGKRRLPCRLGASVTIDDSEPLPWACGQRKQWRSLDDNTYPNRLYETVCESRSCMHGHYNCTPVTYTTHVVQFCSNGRCNDERTPFIYRSVWRFVDVEVTVGCTCTR